MRNLKRVLSLALALVMMLSLMIVGASAAEVKKADFTDKDEIAYNEAVDVMVALEVIEGTDTGAFNPKGVLTREAAAKILCYMLLGPTNAENLTTNTSIFTDVAAGRWSAGYISYCANLGILAGTGDGSFNPEGELTGVAFGKMLLVALGYDPAIEGYVGKDWATSIAADMVDAGIAVNGVVLSNPLTREQAAQMSFQTLTADMVRYASKGTTVNTTDGTSVIVGASEATKVASNNNVKYDGKSDDVQQFCERYFDKLVKDGQDDDFGRPGGVWKLGTKEICFSSDEPVATFTGTFSRKDLYDALGRSVANNLVGSAANGKYTVNYVVDGYDSVSYTGVWDNRTTISGAPHTAAADYDMVANLANDRSETGKVLGANGLLIEVYLVDTNSDGDEDEVKVVMTNTYLAQAADDYDDNKGELKIDVLSDIATGTFPAKVSSDDVTGLTGFQEDDYILITASTTDGTNYTVQTAVAPETITGEVTSYTTSGSKSVTVDGTKYEYSMGQDSDEASNRTYSVGDTEYTMVLDPYGYVMSAKGAAGSDNYLFVREFSHNGNLTVNSEKIADAIFTDGTRQTIILKKVYDTDGTTEASITEGAAGTKGWYSYSEKDGKYTLTALPSATDASHKTAATAVGTSTATAVVTNGTPAVLSKTGTNATVYVILNKDKITTYTGYKEVPTVTTGSADVVYSVVFNNQNYAQYVFIDAGTNATISGGATSDLIFILGTPTTSVNADGTFYTYDAIVNGEKTTIGATSGSLAVGLYVDPSYDKENLDSAHKIIADESDYTVDSYSDKHVTQSGGVLTIDDTVYKLAADCDIKTIDGKTVTNVTASRLANLYKASGDALTAYVYGVMDKDGNYTSLYVHLNGSNPAAAAAVKAVYESAVQTKVTLDSASNKISIGGNDISVTSTMTVDEFLTEVNKVTALTDVWTIAKSADGKDLEFTASTAGAFGSAGAPTTDLAAGLTKVTEGADAIAATATINVAAADASSATIGSHSAQDITGANASGTDAVNGYSWSTKDDPDNAGDYIVTVTKSSAGAAGNGTTDGITFAGGKDAVEAAYKLAAVADKIVAATKSSKDVTICGYATTLTKVELADQLAEFVANYNADAGNTEWVASVGANDDTIVFTAVEAGALTTTEATPPDGTTQVTEGKDAVV